jgi:carbon storage regulator
MLVLTRKSGQDVVLDGGIRITIVSVGRDRVRVGVTAPPDIRVDREEVRRRVAAAATPAEPYLVAAG